MATDLHDLNDVRRYIRQQSGRLDPNSRYVTELLALVDAAADIPDLERLLLQGCRGRYWAGPDTFARMTLREKLLVDLITTETSLMRFEVPEIAHLREAVIPHLKTTRGRILSVPCATGEEPVSLAIENVEAGWTGFSIQGFDIQPACVHTARSGRIPLSGLPRYVLGLVDPIIMAYLCFDVADAFADDLAGPYDFVVCRNFLGYFEPAAVSELVSKLAGLLDNGGVLLLDAFVLGKHPELFADFAMDRHPGLPYFTRPTSA